MNLIEIIGLGIAIFIIIATTIVKFTGKKFI